MFWGGFCAAAKALTVIQATTFLHPPPDEDSNLEPSPLPELDAEMGFPAHEEEEEQRWLDALEKGELDDNGELKKEVDESLLTARQVRRRRRQRQHSGRGVPQCLAKNAGMRVAWGAGGRLGGSGGMGHSWNPGCGVSDPFSPCPGHVLLTFLYRLSWR